MDIIKNFKRNKTAFLASILRRISFLFKDDEMYLKLLYLFELHKWPNLKHPCTFNEKIQWLKLHDRKPEYTIMVDKYAVKDYVAGIIGEEYIIPTLGVWDRFDDIDFDELPRQFVLKTTHGGGGMAVVICKDKNTFDKVKARHILERSLRSDIYTDYREWPYKNVPKRIIAEKYMQADDDDGLTDYKIHNFNGIPKVILVCRERFADSPMAETFFTDEWEKLDIIRPGHPNPTCKQPENLEELLKLARVLSKDIPFVRTDFYTIGGKAYFGEITFYPASGLAPFSPDTFDEEFGQWLWLPLDVKDCNNVEGNVLIYNELKSVFLLLSIQKREADLRDYKFFCFNGIVKFFKIDFGRFTDHHANYYDTDGRLLPFGEAAYSPQPDVDIHIPSTVKNMVMVAEKLSKGIPFLRVDLYSIHGRVFFGEITFYPASGLGKIVPDGWDEKIGSRLKLSML